MKIFSTVFFAWILSLTTPAWAVSDDALSLEFWHLYMAHTVAFQPKNVGLETFLESQGFKPYMNPGKEFYRAGKKINSWPTVSIEGNGLKISDGETSTIVVGMGPEGKLLINDRPFVFDPKKPAVKQMQDFLAKMPVKQVRRFGVPLVSEAQADDRVDNGMEDGAVGSGISLAVLYLGVIAGASISSSVIAGGAAIVGVAGVAGSVACGGAVAFGYVKGNSMGQRYLNCVTKPLSWVGINPRDHLYVKNLQCWNNNFEVTVASSSGIVETRRFQLDGPSDENKSMLKSIEIMGEEHSTTLYPSVNLQRIERAESGALKPITRSIDDKGTKSDKTLNSAQGYLQDYQYYSRVCRDKDRRAEVINQIKHGSEKVPAFDQESPEQMNKSAE